MRQAARGDDRAFGQLYDRRQGAIYRFALQMSGSREIAEDVAQDTFVTLARNMAGYDESRGSVSSYLFGIARNLTLRAIERRRPYSDWDGDELVEPPSAVAGPLEDLLHLEAAETVRRAVLSLPGSYREAVVLCDLQELSYEEAAGIIGCPVGTVRSKLNRGRSLLTEKLRSKRCFA